MDTGKTCVIILFSLLALFEQSESKGLCEFAEMFPSKGSESCFQLKAKIEDKDTSTLDKNADDISTERTFSNNATPENNNTTSPSASNGMSTGRKNATDISTKASNDATPETNNPTSPSASNDPATVRCPENMVYGNCSCQPTCQEPQNESRCEDECTEKFICVCPVGFLRRGGDCVPEKDCSCFIDEGGVIKDGGSFVYPNCSAICFCTNDHLTCEEYNCSANATCQEMGGAYQCQCNKGFSGDGRICVTAPTDCMELYKAGVTSNGVYTIQPVGWPSPGFKVYCEMETNGGGWTVFQRRVDGTVDFYRNWTSYKEGFGRLDQEFWLGNDKLHTFTNQKNYQLRVDAVNSQGTSIYNWHNTFRINDEDDKYRLTITDISGGNTGSDSALIRNNNKQFSTHDQDNDRGTTYFCAREHEGAWWYSDHHYSSYSHCYRWDSGPNTYRYHYCSYSNLNGDYQGSGVQSIFFYQGNSIENSCGITRSEMKLRPF